MNEKATAKDLYSLQDSLGPEDYLDFLRLLRASDSRLFLIVEGWSDVTALRRSINDAECDVLPAGSKQSVINSVIMFTAEDQNTIGLVDRDFDTNLEASIPDSIAATKLYDREMDSLVIGGLLATYVLMHKDEALMDTHIGSASVSDLADRLIAASWRIGTLRWLAVRDSLGLGMHKISLVDLVNDDISIDIGSLVRRAIAKGERVVADEQDITVRLQQECNQEFNYALCCGHDLVQIIALSCRSWSRQELRIKDVEKFVNENFTVEVRKLMPWAIELENLASARGRQLWRDAQ